MNVELLRFRDEWSLMEANVGNNGGDVTVLGINSG